MIHVPLTNVETDMAPCSKASSLSGFFMLPRKFEGGWGLETWLVEV